MNCPFGNERCLCQSCTDNAKYDGCERGYCIYCYECEQAQETVHDVYFCTGHNKIESECLE